MDDIRSSLPHKPKRFMDQVRHKIRAKNLAYKAEKTFCYWISNFIRFHNMQHLQNMGVAEIKA